MGFRFLFSAMVVAATIVFPKASAACEGEMNMVFYMHDNVIGNNMTVIPVVGSNGSSSRLGRFGMVIVITDIITKHTCIISSRVVLSHSLKRF
jgi:hypothetical protein